MSAKARTYIAFVLALGVVCLARGFLAWNGRDLPRLLFYLFLAVPASCLKVRIPGVTGTISVSFLFVLAGVVELGLAEALVISTACALAQSFWHARTRPRLVQVLFSVSDLAIAVTAATIAFEAAWPRMLGAAPFRLAAASSAYFFANTLPVAVVIALTEGKPAWQIWRKSYWWSFPFYLVGAALVGVVNFGNRTLGWRVWLLIVPVAYVLYRSSRLYLKQVETERTHAEEQRRRAEEIAALHAEVVDALRSATAAKATLEAAIQASPLAIIGLGRQRHVTSWNAGAERMFGRKQEEVLNRPLPLAGGILGEIVQAAENHLAGAEMLSGAEVSERRRDGSQFEAAIWTAALRDPNDEVAGIVAAVADVSDRRRLEEQLRVSQKMEAVGRLAGGIAHEFNNLLTVINGYSAMLLDSVKHDPSLAGEIEQILNAGTRAAELVSKLLTLSGRQLIEPRLLNLNQLVIDIAPILRQLIGEQVDLKVRLKPEAGWIVADRNQIEAALMNLATNARDAMPQGGVLSIETAQVAIAGLDAPADPVLPPGSYVRVLVSDTGHGMDEETRQHIFEPFFTTKQLGKGTGLGLSSVYGAIEQNGGHVFAASAVGQGATFSIYLPRLERPALSETPRQTSEKLPSGTETILLVEDEAAVRRMLRGALSNAGYRVWEAAQGAEALERWAAEVDKLDLLVTDVVMPVMNGVRLAEELRKRRPDLKVVLMSGHSADTLISQGALEAGAVLLSKPFPPGALVSKVREVLDTMPRHDHPVSSA